MKDEKFPAPPLPPMFEAREVADNRIRPPGSRMTKAQYEASMLSLMENYLRGRDDATARSTLMYWLFAHTRNRLGLGSGVSPAHITQEAWDALHECLDKYQEIVERLQRAN